MVSDTDQDSVIDVDAVFTDGEGGAENIDNPEGENIDKGNEPRGSSSNDFLANKSASDVVTFLGMTISSILKSAANKKNSKMYDIGSTLAGAVGFTAAKRMDPAFTFERYEKNEKAYESLLTQMLQNANSEVESENVTPEDKGKL